MDLLLHLFQDAKEVLYLPLSFHAAGESAAEVLEVK